MAVHYTGGGGGLLGTLGRALGAASAFIPGLQPLAPYIGAASALANGDVGGAISSAAGPLLSNATKAAAPNESLMGAVSSAMRNPRPEAMAGDPTGGSWTRAYNGMPDWNTDPVTGQPNKFKHPWGWH